MSKKFDGLVLRRPATVRDALESINGNSRRSVIVVDDAGCIVGLVTDPDLRRGFLRGISLDASVDEVMNLKPVIARASQTRQQIHQLIRVHGFDIIPVVDSDGRVVDVEWLPEAMGLLPMHNHVVLMAGGRGQRLGSYTVNTPKPMLQLGDKPLLETTVESFAEQGFQTIWISVNYLADVIRRHFGDGERWGISIRYIEEGQPLGTAGALRQIGESQTESFIVMNGDILTKLNFRNLIDEHRRHGFDATICTRMHDITVPYGVLNLNGNAVVGMTEKPKIRYPVNAGIYVLPPAVPQLIPENQPFGMDQLIQGMLNAGLRIGAHLLSDYWADIGDVNDLERASRDFEKIFSSPQFEKQEA